MTATATARPRSGARRHESDLADLRRDIERVFVSGTESAIRQAQADGMIDPAIDATDATGVAVALSAMVDRTCYVTFVVGDGKRNSVDEVTDVLTGIWCAALGMAPAG